MAALEACFQDMNALTSDLGADEWGVQSLCPEWDVRGCVGHVVGVDNLLAGWVPQTAEDAPPFHRIGEFAEAIADLEGAAIAAKVADVHAVRASDLAALSDDQWSQACMTPVGPGNYGRFMNVRVFDYWVHQRDICMPLGRTTDDSGPAAEIALDEVHQSMGYIAGKRIGLPDGLSMTFDLSGGIDRQIHVAVEGRAGLVDQLDNPDVTVSADTTTFIMLACGRIDPQEQIDAGRISWSGDDQWGDAAARNLRFTM